MTKKLIFLLAATGLVFITNGCTSQKADEETPVVENADAEKIEGDTLELSDTQTDPALDAALSETPVTDANATPLTEQSAAAAVAAGGGNPPPPELTETPLVEGTNSMDAGMTTTETTTKTTIEGNAPPVVETSTTVTETQSMGGGAVTDIPAGSDELTETPITDQAVVESTLNDHTPTPVAAGVSYSESSNKAPVKAASGGGALKKVALTTPYQLKSGSWINTVYVVRPKETLADISNKIYGSDRSADLKKITENSYLRSRSPRAGDKIYYTSPNRPDDSSKTLLYQEDIGLTPETYVAKAGDNLRKVSKELLGFDGAWKEMWTSNSVDSKAALKEGELLRYWPTDTGATTAPPPSTTEAAPAPTEGTANLIDASQAPTTADAAALPPPPDAAGATLPPPPAEGTVDPMAADAAALPPPPAESTAEIPPPPPPEEQAVAATPRKKINLDEEVANEDGGLDSDTMMSLGALGVLVALLAFVIIRRKKQKAAQDQQNTEMNA